MRRTRAWSSVCSIIVHKPKYFSIAMNIKTKLHTVLAFVRLTRPMFLFGGVILHALGMAIAASQGIVIDPGRAALGQILVTSIQVMAHYSNEYFDFEVDRLIGDKRTWFSGGSGVLPSGELDRTVARHAALGCAAVEGQVEREHEQREREGPDRLGLPDRQRGERPKVEQREPKAKRQGRHPQALAAG